MFKGFFFLCFAASQIAVFGALDFQWATPNPHRQAWRAMASGNGRIVGITDAMGGRSVFTSRDGRSWQQPSAPPQARLQDIRFHDGRFFAVGVSPSVFTSTDGETWNEHPTGAPMMHFFSVAHGNGVTVTIGYYGQTLVSTDLERWQQVEIFSDREPYGIAFGNGRFVWTSHREVWTSTNGLSWTRQKNLADPAYNLVFSAGRFAMLFADSEAPGGILTSVDGESWQLATTNKFRLVATPSGFLGIKNGVWKSADGAVWDKILDYPRSDHLEVNCAAELNGLHVAGGTRGILLVATNAVDWESLVPFTDLSKGKLAFGNGQFLLYGEGGVSVSTNGATWQKASDAPVFNCLIYGDGRWVGATTDGSFATSTDAQTWSFHPAPFPVGWIHFAGGVFLAETSDGQFGAVLPSLAISSNGASWRRIDFPDAAWVKVFGNVNGRWAAALDRSRPITSADGENWTVHPADLNMNAGLTAAGNGRFLSISGGGMGPPSASWSLDGIAWQRQRLTTGTTYVEQSLTFDAGTFILTDISGNVYTSPDGLVWSGRRQVEYQHFSSAAFGHGYWLLASGDSILRSSPASAPVFSLNLQSSGSYWRLILKGTPGNVFDIQTSFDVNGAWRTIQQLQLANDPITSTHIEATAGQTFFRAVAAWR